MTAPNVRSVDQFTGNQAGAPELSEVEQLRADNDRLAARVTALTVERDHLQALCAAHSDETRSQRLKAAFEASQDKRVGR